MVDADRYLCLLGHRSLKLGPGVRHGEPLHYGKVKFDFIYRRVFVVNGAGKVEIVFGSFCFLDRKRVILIHMEIDSVGLPRIGACRVGRTVYRSPMDSIPIYNAER